MPHTVSADAPHATPTTVPAVGFPPNLADTYEVTVLRTEMITFSLPAASVQDAQERYLLDGDETGSDTVGLRVDSIKRLDQEQTRT